jgi:anti-sigma regulatory factor (Ser/Thr protein kinase)
MAMKEGYSTATREMREMGFGAGMGLPNIEKNSDEFIIESVVSKGTKLLFKVNLD